MRRGILVVCAMAILALAAGRTNAATVYSNGPYNGNYNGVYISFPYLVSDSFTVTSPTSLTGAAIVTWTDPGAVASSLEWEIGTSPFGSDVSSGESSVSSTYLFTNGHGYDINEATFALNGVLTPAQRTGSRSTIAALRWRFRRLGRE